jgi:hypothetical protein
MLSFYEATTDPVFPPFNFVEFPLKFGCGAYLKHPYDIVCVEVGVHGGILKVEVAWSSRILPKDVFENLTFFYST